MNGDGKPDLTVANYNSQTVSVLLGNGNGTFQAMQTFATRPYPWSVTLGDLNGDGKPDLTISYRRTNSVGVSLGNGNGTFQAPQTFATGSQPYSVALGDMNGDGRPDLAVANFSSWTVSVLLGTGTGNFTGQTYALDHVAPSVLSINRTTPAAAKTNASSVSYTATFSEPVTGVDPTDFSLVETGTVGATLTQVTAVSSTVYTVTVSGITGSGTLGLNLVDNGSVNDLAGNTLATPNAVASFANQATFAAGVDPFSVTMGDVNGDGKPDLVVANNINSSNSVSVLLGNGNGTFQAPLSFATGSSPTSVTIGDVNGDTKPDLIVANENSATVSVLLGNGNGTFQTQQTFATGVGPFSVTVGDVNGDGRLDIAVANHNANSVGVLLGNGNGTFQAQQTFTTGSQPFSITLGDVNGDGKPDLAVAFFSGVSVLLGNGNGTFQSHQTFGTGNFPTAVTMGDVNGDGKPDLALANVNSNTVSVLLGNGNGTFGAQQTFATGAGPYSVKLGDVNGDGKPDLAVANRTDYTVSVLLGNGTGTFGTQQVFATGTAPRSTTIGDVNGDGKPDLIVGNSFSSSVSVLLGNGNGNFTGQVYTLDHVSPSVVSINRTIPVGATTNANSVVYTATFSEPVTGVDSTDFSLVKTGTVGATQTNVTVVSSLVYTVTVSGITGIGTLGLNLVDDGSIRDLVGNPLASPSAPASFANQTTFATGTSPISVAIGDVNGDNKPDLVIANPSNSRISLLLGNGNGTFQDQQTVASGLTTNSVVLRDLNGDGKLDLVIENRLNNSVGVMLGNGNGTFQPQQTFATGSVPDTVVVADLNGDGKLDIAVTNSLSNTLSVLLGNGNGTFQSQHTFATGTKPYSLILGDVNGDGRPDLIVANKGSDTVSVLLGNGDGTFQSQQTFATGLVPNSVAMSDVNGDGKPDLIVANFNSSSVSVLLGTGNGTFGVQQTFATASGPTFAAVGDVNGDGKPDLIVTTEIANNTVSVLLGNGNGTFQVPQTFATGTHPLSVALGDLNGDGKVDLVISNYTNSSVSVLLGSGNDNFTGQVYTIAASPTVTTPTSLNVTDTTVALGGNVTNDGGSPITERGVVYALTSGNPNPQIGGAGVTQVRASGTTGVFTVNATNLTVGAVYSFVAYATNSVGTAYTSPVSTFRDSTINPPIVTAVYAGAGPLVVHTGDTLTSSVTALSVAFSDNMNAVSAGASSVTNPSNWRLTRYGIDVTNQISGITFAYNQSTLQYVAAVSFSLPLFQGGYQLVARHTIQDVTGRPLDGDADGIAGGDFRINFYVATTVGGTTDIAPWLYQIEDKPLNAVASLTTPVTTSLLVFDADSNNWTGATIQIASNYQNGQDVLGFVNTPKITGSWDVTGGTLTLSGTDTVSNYRIALHNVTYHNTSVTPNTAVVRTIDFQTTDGLLQSNVISRDVTVMASSIPAVLSGVSGTGTYFQGAAAIAIGSSLVITDPNTVNLASATVSFTNWQGEDRLNFSNIFALQHTYFQDLVAHTATLTITGNDTVDHYQTLLRSVIYWDVSGNPVKTARVASFTVSDGLSTSNAVTRNTVVVAVNQPPTLTSIETTSLAYKANDPAFPPLPISTTLLVGDPDSNNLTKATVQITGGYQNDANGADVLSFATQLGITGSFNAATGTMTLTGSSGVGNYRTAIRAVTFSASGSAVSTTNRTLTILVTDDFSPTPANSLSTTRTVTVSTTNLPPALAGIPVAPLAYARGTSATAIAPSVLTYDPDSINLTQAMIQVSSNYQNGEDVLSFTSGFGVTGSFAAATGTLTLTGTTSLANYQTLLRSVTYKTNTGTASTLTRTISFIVNDGLASSNAVTRNVTPS